MMINSRMMRTISKNSGYMQRFYSGLLLGSLLFSSTATFTANRQTKTESAASIRSSLTLFRNYALTTLPDQRTAGDTSKQNRLKHSVTHGGLAPKETGEPARTLRQLITTERSGVYLSCRLSRPGGRAPPAFA
jgi:hypothetical protein